MIERGLSAQRLAGAGAVALLIFLLLSPLTAALGRIAANERLLSESRLTETLLHDRLAAARETLQRDEKLYARLQHSLVAETVAEEIKIACENALARFAALAVEQSCQQAQNALGADLMHHSGILAVNGPPEKLLQALDGGAPDATLDQLRIIYDVEAQGSASLIMRFSDVSKPPPSEGTAE